MFTGITEDIGFIKSISARDPAEYKIETKMDLKKSSKNVLKQYPNKSAPKEAR